MRLFKLRFHMSEQDDGQISTLQRPATNDRDAWRAYWIAQGSSWRIEPEIGAERQKYLAERLTIVPNIEKGIYPFKDIKLSRADVEWLLATHENGRGPIDWSDESQRKREGIDLRGTLLQEIDLHGLPLAHLIGGRWGDQAPPIWATVQGDDDRGAGIQLQKADLKGAQLQGAQLQKADMRGSQLQEVNLSKACLQEAHIDEANLQKAELSLAQLQGATLVGAQLQKARLIRTQLQGADLLAANFYHTDLYGAQLQKSRLIGAEFEKTGLGETRFADTNGVGPCVADIFWGETILAVVNWSQVKILGDEYRTKQKRYIDESDRDIVNKIKDREVQSIEFAGAVRANRQLAVVLQSQGLNEFASYFAYRAQLCQRIVLRRKKKFGQYIFSGFLDVLAGYGYRPGRSVIWYLATILVFALAYHFLGGLTLYPPDAFIFSIMSFHGRGFFPALSQETNLHNPLVMLAAAEAIIGLLVEISFIATFTQRFFGR